MMKSLKSTKQIRQGDVLLLAVAALPAGAVLAEGQGRKIILAWGEVTGHHHRIEDHVREVSPEAAAEITDAAIARAKARLWIAPSGDRFLEVKEPVHLLHEEHTAHMIPPGLYELPVQVEHSADDMVRAVAD